MTTSTSNRFTAMFDKTGVTERKPKARKQIDFGAALGDDEAINDTFKSLHEETVKPVIVKPVVIPSPVIEDVAIRNPANSSEQLNRPRAVKSPSSPSTSTVIVSDPSPTAQTTTIRPSDSPTVIQSDAMTVEWSDAFTVGQSDSQMVAPFDGLTVTQLHSQTVTSSDAETVRQSHGHTVEPSHSQTRQKHDFYTSSINTRVMDEGHIPLDVLTLPYNQACVLEYLCKAGGTTNYRDIQAHTNIKMPSARDAIARLIQKGFMGPLVTMRSASFQGFTYVLNERMCNCFLAAGGLERKTYQTIPQTIRPSDPETVSQSNGASLHSSSIVLETLTTTSQPSDSQTVEQSAPQTVRQSDSSQFVLSGPESAYWEDIGLQERQAQKWCEDFEVSPIDMRQQLAWARWDLVQNGKEADVTKDAISWFFGCLRKTAGCYPRPDNYQSPSELRAARIKLQQDRNNLAQSALVEAEMDERFRFLLSSPESREYAELYEQVNSFAKEQGGFALETEMKRLFFEKNGVKA